MRERLCVYELVGVGVLIGPYVCWWCVCECWVVCVCVWWCAREIVCVCGDVVCVYVLVDVCVIGVCEVVCVCVMVWVR